MMNKTKVHEVMTSHVATLKPNMGASVALRVLIDNKQSGAPVVNDDNELLGVLSEADCMRSAMLGGYYEQDSWIVGEQMSKELHTVTEDTSLMNAAEIMINQKRRMLPVVRDGKLVGMITRHHLLKTFLDQVHPVHN